MIIVVSAHWEESAATLLGAAAPPMFYDYYGFPAAHLTLGRALRGLAGENVLVVGSGFSFHDMEAFAWHGDGAPDPDSDAFQDWLAETCAGPLTQAERERRLAAWEEAPSARYCHPRGAPATAARLRRHGGRPAEVVFDDRILGKRALAFLW